MAMFVAKTDAKMTHPTMILDYVLNVCAPF